MVMPVIDDSVSWPANEPNCSASATKGLSRGASSAEIDGMSDIEYLAQSLYEPDVYIVEGFLPGMPPISKPPIGLSDEEILSVMGYNTGALWFSEVESSESSSSRIASR